MSPDTTTRRAFRPVVLKRGLALTATLSLSFGVGGCAVGNVVKAVHALANVAGNMKNLEKEIQKGENAKYEATYKSTGGGSSTSTVTIAQEPGGKWAYNTPASDGNGATSWVANGKDSYDCTQATSGGKWSCMESVEASGNDAIDDSPAVGYLGVGVYAVVDSLSAVAAIEGYSVSNKNTSVNGISLKCTTITGKDNGQSVNDEWCITSDGILGLVKETGSGSSNNSAFTITSLNKSPSSSVFNPPSGAAITMASA
jgi:hypothetical protein